MFNIVHEDLRPLGDCLTFSWIIELLGISIDTRRFRDRTGHRSPWRYPVNRYRRYRRESLRDRLEETGGGGDRSGAAR